MENILSQFNADSLDIKLTDEKLFINTASSSEAFALRSVNGIGVVDLVDDYNKALTFWKQDVLSQKISMALGLIFGILGLLMSNEIISFGFGSSFIGSALLIIGGFFIIIALILIALKKNKKEPKLMSAVRIMMSGGNRDFQFDKTGIKSGNVAEFVAKVESTLTSYHKKDA